MSATATKRKKRKAYRPPERLPLAENVVRYLMYRESVRSLSIANGVKTYGRYRREKMVLLQVSKSSNPLRVTCYDHVASQFVFVVGDPLEVARALREMPGVVFSVGEAIP